MIQTQQHFITKILQCDGTYFKYTGFRLTYFFHVILYWPKISTITKPFWKTFKEIGKVNLAKIFDWSVITLLTIYLCNLEDSSKHRAWSLSSEGMPFLGLTRAAVTCKSTKIKTEEPSSLTQINGIPQVPQGHNHLISKSSKTFGLSFYSQTCFAFVLHFADSKSISASLYVFRGIFF